MQKELRYTSTIRDFPLMYFEMKKTAILLCEGNNEEDILLLSIKDNIYQLDKDKRRRSLPLKMTKRLATINITLINALASSSADEGKLIAFIALMKAERLVFEYMHDVYASKANFDIILDIDFMHFIDRLATNNETIANWKPDTLKNLNSKIKSILCDAGLAKRTKKGIVVQKPIAIEELFSLIDEDDMVYAKAIC